MKTKLGLSIIISFLIMQFTYSQTEKQDTFYRSAGVDATFINNFLPLDNPIGLRGNYLLHYIKYDKDGKLTKHGLDVLMLGNLENNESDINVDDARIDIQYKIGRGRRKDAFKNAYVIYGTEFGVDYFLNRRSIIDPTDFVGKSLNTNLDQSVTASIGPFVGFGYNICTRISIYTEAGAYLRITYGVDTFKSELDQTLDFKDSKISANTSFALPRALILFYHF